MYKKEVILMFRLLVLISLISLVIAVYAELGLKPVGPDDGEPVEYTFNQRFSLKNALRSLETINSALMSFEKLTKESKTFVSEKKLKEIGNTDWETQNLALPNCIGAIEGTLRKQEYLIKRLSYELAQEKATSGEINKKQLRNAQKEKQQAEKSFQTFWDSFGIAD